MASLTFLGTCGGRFVLLTQRRYSGGIWLDLNVKAIIDPGPGALIRALEFKKDVRNLDAVLVSHKHLDHYNDTELMIEAMTGGMKKDRGILIANEGVLSYISEYHKNRVKTMVAKPDKMFNIVDIKVQAIPTEKHVDGNGFKFFTNAGVFTYTSDTDYSKRLIPYYQDSRVLIINCIFPYSRDVTTHLNTRKAMRIVREAKPEMAILTHFGMQMLNANPDKEAEIIESKTGIKTIAARDGMTIDVDTLEVCRDEEENKKQLTLDDF